MFVVCLVISANCIIVNTNYYCMCTTYVYIYICIYAYTCLYIYIYICLIHIILLKPYIACIHKIVVKIIAHWFIEWAFFIAIPERLIGTYIFGINLVSTTYNIYLVKIGTWNEGLIGRLSQSSPKTQEWIISTDWLCRSDIFTSIYIYIYIESTGWKYPRLVNCP